MSKAKIDRTTVGSTNHYSTRAEWLRAILASGQLPMVMWLAPDKPHIAVVGRQYDHDRDSAAWSYSHAQRARLVPYLERLGLVALDYAGVWFCRDGVTRPMRRDGSAVGGAV